MSSETILRTLYGQLRAPGLINLKPLHDELALLGMSATDKDLLALKAIAESASSLDDAITRIRATDTTQLAAIARDQKAKLDVDKAKAQKDALLRKEREEQRKREKQAADNEAARVKKEANERAEKAKKDEAEAAKNARSAVKFANPDSYISDYMVLKDPTSYGLTDKVKSYIKSGWVPVGGVCTYPMFAKVGFSAQDLFYQAMVKHDYYK